MCTHLLPDPLINAPMLNKRPTQAYGNGCPLDPVEKEQWKPETFLTMETCLSPSLLQGEALLCHGPFPTPLFSVPLVFFVNSEGPLDLP